MGSISEPPWLEILGVRVPILGEIIGDNVRLSLFFRDFGTLEPQGQIDGRRH